MTRARNPSKVFERIAKNRWHRLFTDEEQKTDYSHGHGMLSDCHFKHLQIVGAFFLHKPNFLQSEWVRQKQNAIVTSSIDFPPCSLSGP